MAKWVVLCAVAVRRGWLLLVSAAVAGLLVACGGGCAGAPAADAVFDARSDEEFARELQGALDGWRERSDVTGVVLGVHAPGRGAVEVASGVSNRFLGTPMAPGDRVYAGSVTKTFTAAAVLELVEEGAMSLDERLSRWFPDFPEAGVITVEALLNHTSGIPDYYDSRGLVNELYATPEQVWTRERIFDEAAAMGLMFPPGEDCHYSNTNYLFLGRIVEAVTGNALDVELRRRFFEPLGLEQTYLAGAEEAPGGVVPGYMNVDGLRRRDSPGRAVLSAAWASGALVSTVGDLVRWARAVYGGDVLEESSRRAMVTAGPYPERVAAAAGSRGSRYGLGTTLWRTRAGEAVGHGGAIFSFTSVMAYVPGRDIGVAAAANEVWHESERCVRRPDLGELLDEVLRVIAGE